MPTSDRFVETLEDEFSLDDVGSTLLKELAEGLYQAHEVMREYIQNAVDAHRMWLNEVGAYPEEPIQVEIRGNRISILDYGAGMGEEEIRKVKSIAVSKKGVEDIGLTGYKGVGIWAGLSFFKTLKLYSTKRGSAKGYELIIDFGNIVSSISDTASIGDVLNPNYSIDVYEANEDEHFTNVTLEEPVRAGDVFLDSKHVVDAVRSICPCEIDPNFVFHDEVVDWHGKHDLELFSIEVNGKPVYRSYSSAVDEFDSGEITINDEPVAVYWKAIHKHNRVISPSDGQLAGFRLVRRGFVLGDANLYSEIELKGFPPLRVQRYLDWYVGEIHLLSHGLRPDLERRRLEESELTRQFIGRLREWYKDREQDARTFSKMRRVLKEYKEYEEYLEGVEHKPDSDGPVPSDTEAAKRLEEIREQLNEHVGTVQKYKRKRNVSPDIKALRKLRRQRARLLSQIGELLPESSALGEADEEDPLHKQAKADEVAVEGTVGVQEELDLEDTSQPTQADLSVLVDETDRELREVSVSIDVVLGLLAEILGEHLPDESATQKAIMSKLEKRLDEIASGI